MIKFDSIFVIVVVVAYQELLHHVFQNFVGQGSQSWLSNFEGLDSAVDS